MAYFIYQTVGGAGGDDKSAGCELAELRADTEPRQQPPADVCWVGGAPRVRDYGDLSRTPGRGLPPGEEEGWEEEKAKNERCCWLVVVVVVPDVFFNSSPRRLLFFEFSRKLIHAPVRDSPLVICAR